MTPTERLNEPDLDRELLPAAPTSAGTVGAPRWRRLGIPHWLGLLLSNRLAAIGSAVLLIMVLMAIFAPLLTPYNPGDMIALPSQPPSPEHWFGTNHQGQDILSQVAYGARFSLFIGFAAGLATTFLAIVVGMTAGYIGGWVDDALGVVMNVFLVIPQLPLLIVLAAYIPVKGAAAMIIVISVTGWAWGARVLRSQTLALRNRDFVQAALVSGESTGRLIFAEVLPNMISLIASSYIFAFIGAILTESGLEFLGFGDVNNISWGTTLYWAQTNSTLLTGEWWHFLFPGLAIALTATACIFINYGIDTISNPRLRVIKARKPHKRPRVQTATGPQVA
jgi:peptide/nickel transport system permease protein